MLAIQGSQTVFKIPLLSSLVLLFSIHWVWLAPNVHNNRKVVDLLREFVIVGRMVLAVECVQLCCFFTLMKAVILGCRNISIFVQ